jgi:hypothetical protein
MIKNSSSSILLAAYSVFTYPVASFDVSFIFIHFFTDLSPEAEASALSMAEAVKSGLIVIK